MNTQQAHDYGKFDFVGKIGLFGGMAVFFVVASLIYLGVHGITYGIDFAGGTEMQVKFGKETSIAQVRELTEKQGLKDASIQGFEGSEYVIRYQTEQGKTDKETNDIQQASAEKLKTAIHAEFGANEPDIRRVDSVGPQVGAELKRNGVLAVFYCLLVILIYIALRFDYKYAPGAVVCLAHDAIITLAIFELSGREMNIPILAAVLTLIGYSLNDTIVVFDRIRETEHESGNRGWKFVINKAINDMFARTLITSGTTFTSALCLYLFAGGVVSDIAFALTIGIFFGTFSSIYVAAPLILLTDKLKHLRA